MALRGFGFPRDVENHLFVIWIGRVRMLFPSGGHEIDLDVAVFWRFIPDLYQSAAKVWTSLVIPEAGMKNADATTVRRAKFFRDEPLIEPDLLQQLFRGRLVRLFG